MPEPFSTLGPFATIPTYTLHVALGILGALMLALWVRPRTGSRRPGAIMDAALVAIAAGLLLARGFHVLLHWDYFSDHRAEITAITAGGLDWHGAVIGALVGLVVVGWLRRVDIAALLGGLAPALALLAFMAWWGCGANHCAYGAEVANLSAHPAWLVWEEADIFNIYAPRYRTQPLGMMLSGALFVLSLVIAWRGWLDHHPDRRFWLVLALLSAGMFAIGGLRGDAVAEIGGIRADRLLDVAFVVFALAVLALRRHRGYKAPQNAH